MDNEKEHNAIFHTYPPPSPSLADKKSLKVACRTCQIFENKLFMVTPYFLSKYFTIRMIK